EIGLPNVVLANSDDALQAVSGDGHFEDGQASIVVTLMPAQLLPNPGVDWSSVYAIYNTTETYIGLGINNAVISLGPPELVGQIGDQQLQRIPLTVGDAAKGTLLAFPLDDEVIAIVVTATNADLLTTEATETAALALAASIVYSGT